MFDFSLSEEDLNLGESKDFPSLFFEKVFYFFIFFAFGDFRSI